MRFGSIVTIRPFFTALIADQPVRAATCSGFAEYGAAARTSTSRPADASFSIVPSENFTMSTRSGLSETTFSKFTLMPPTFSIDFAAAGSSEKSSVPTSRLPAPSAKRNSVIDGPIETIRSGRLGIVMLRSWKSLTVAGKAAGDDAAVLVGEAEVVAGAAFGPQAARRKRRTAKSLANGTGIWRTPFSRRRVSRERVARRPECDGC